MSECTVLELKERLNDVNVTLVDVREFPEFAAGRIPGAKLIPLGEIERRNRELDQENAIYVICRSGRRSLQARQKLLALGFSNVTNVAGGTDAWRSEGLPVEKDVNAVWDLERQVRFTAGTIVLTGVILALFVNWYFIAIAGFVGAGLVFAAATDTCAMGMMLAKMPWNKAAQACSTSK